MKKVLLSALLAAASVGAANAQFGYTFSVQTGQAYTPLTTGATNLTAATAWDGQVYSIPFGFTFQLDRRPLANLRVSNLDGLTYFGRESGNGDTVTGFVALDGDLRDRGAAGTPATPKSPIRYAVSGTTPSRIFKLEYFNAGFRDDNSGADSVNFQVWFYEGSNAVELRYGQSHLTPANLPAYFQLAVGQPFVGLFKNVDFDNGTYGKLYYLRGASASPAVDSVTLPSTPASNVSSFPASGTVYRFTPTGGGSTSIGDAIAAARALKLYPTVASESITVEWAGADGEPYQIVGVNGQQLRNGRLQRAGQRINVDALPAGTYYLELSAGTHVFVKR